MIISVSNTVTHNTACQKQISNQKELKETVIQKLKTLGLTSEDVAWNEDGHLQILKHNSLKLHSLLLEIESLGVDVKMTNQTLIEIN